jgi:hypothetical protein
MRSLTAVAMIALSTSLSFVSSARADEKDSTLIWRGTVPTARVMDRHGTVAFCYPTRRRSPIKGDETIFVRHVECPPEYPGILDDIGVPEDGLFKNDNNAHHVKVVRDKHGNETIVLY